MVLVPAILGGISLLTTVAQVQQQRAAAANAASGAAFTAEMQRINSQREIELDRINTEKQKQFADRMLEINQRGRTLDAIQSSHDYRQGMMQLNEQTRQQRSQLQIANNQAETQYFQQRAALDKYDSDLRRAYQQNSFNLKNDLYQTELNARAQYQLGSQQARIDNASSQYALREEFVEGNQQYQTTRYNLIQQAQGASRQRQQEIRQQLGELDRMAYEAQSAYDALALRGQSDTEQANAIAVDAARQAFRGNAEIAQLSNEDLSNYMSQIRIADLTAELGMSEEELGIAMGLNDELMGERLRSLETLNDVFQTYFPAIEEHSMAALEAGNEAAVLGSQYQRQMLNNQRRSNQISNTINQGMLNYNQALGANALRGQFQGSQYNRRLQNYMDRLNTIYTKDNLGAQAAANRGAANSRTAMADAQAISAQSQVPSFFSSFVGALPGIAQAGMYGYQAYQQTQPVQSPVYGQAPVNPTLPVNQRIPYSVS